MDWKLKYSKKLITAEEAARKISSGNRVSFPISIKPSTVGLELAKRANELKNVTVVSIWGANYPWFNPGMEESFSVIEGCGTPFTLKGIKEKRIVWSPVMPGQVRPDFMADQSRDSFMGYADVCLIHITPPNDEGFCSFGHLVWTQPVSSATAKMVIAEIDPNLPWTCGDSIHVSKLDYMVDDSKPFVLPSGFGNMPSTDDIEKTHVIASLAADLVKDGDTIQVGVGTIGELFSEFLSTRNDLGIDSELLLPSIVNLVKKGVANGTKKNINKSKIPTTALALTAGQDIIDYVNNNSEFEFRDSSYVLDPARIAMNDNMVACNSLLGVDLLGQCVIDHVNGVPVSGPGGNLEYTVGSHYSKGGRSIHCMLSTALNGTVSRIVPQIEAGNVVGIPMMYLDYLVTEFGVANLSLKGRKQRAEAIISVAHPDFQPELRKAAKELFWP